MIGLFGRYCHFANPKPRQLFYNSSHWFFIDDIISQPKKILFFKSRGGNVFRYFSSPVAGSRLVDTGFSSISSYLSEISRRVDEIQKKTNELLNLSSSYHVYNTQLVISPYYNIGSRVGFFGTPNPVPISHDAYNTDFIITSKSGRTDWGHAFVDISYDLEDSGSYDLTPVLVAGSKNLYSITVPCIKLQKKYNISYYKYAFGVSCCDATDFKMFERI